MTRIILTTCGTSFFQTSCWEYKGLNAKYPSQMEDKETREKHEKRCEAYLGLARDEGEDISPYFDRGPWDELSYLRDLPAELASLRAIQIYFENREDEEPLGKGDKVILLHSDNEDGKYCAEMICKVLTDKNFNLLPEVEIDSWEVVGLDPADSDEFMGALSKIWVGCVRQFPEAGGTRYIFNLTGGYKGIAILLGAFAYLKELDTSIFYLYEETNYEQISIMGFNKSKSKEKRFCAGYFNIRDMKPKPIFGSHDSFDK